MAATPPELLEQQNIHPADPPPPDGRGGPYEQPHHDAARHGCQAREVSESRPPEREPSIVLRVSAPKLRLRLDGSSREMHIELPGLSGGSELQQRRAGEQTPLVRADEAERGLAVSFVPRALREHFAGSAEERRAEALSDAELAAAARGVVSDSNELWALFDPLYLEVLARAAADRQPGGANDAR